MGTSCKSPRTEQKAWDHPHAYGDKCRCSVAAVVKGGSSPRVWGQVAKMLPGIVNDRIIPTRMGTRGASGWNLYNCRDHPHAYGDKSSTTGNRSAKLGSSPRVWGQALFCISINLFSRIIPTRMGTRVLPFDTATSVGDHPHAYGDKFIVFCSCGSFDGSSPRVWGQAYPHKALFLCRPGSSPRVWGQEIINQSEEVQMRIIPTRMGTSS